MSISKKSSAVAALALAVAASTVSFNDAEARWRGHRGAGLAAGIAAGALIGGALLAPRAYAQPYYYGAPAYYGGPVYVEEPAVDCYVQRQRVWSERRGRYVVVDRQVCD